MGFFSKMQCGVGAHDWSTWSRIGSTCKEGRSCLRSCGKSQEQDSHSWSTWNVKDSSECLESRSCERCDEQEVRNNHNFGPADYRKPGSCELVKQCSKCRTWFSDGIKHGAEQWRFYGENSCNGASHCMRCGEGIRHAVKHQFEFRYNNDHSCLGSDMCLRCGAKENPQTVHIGHTGNCRRCGKPV